MEVVMKNCFRADRILNESSALEKLVKNVLAFELGKFINQSRNLESCSHNSTKNSYDFEFYGLEYIMKFLSESYNFVDNGIFSRVENLFILLSFNYLKNQSLKLKPSSYLDYAVELLFLHFSQEISEKSLMEFRIALIQKYKGLDALLKSYETKLGRCA